MLVKIYPVLTPYSLCSGDFYHVSDQQLFYNKYLTACIQPYVPNVFLSKPNKNWTKLIHFSLLQNNLAS